jgi:hypothetical protein
MKLSEVLQGKRAGRIQKCGIMSVVPIFFQDEDLMCHGIGTPSQSLKLQRNNNYGEMNFHNEDREKVMVVPTNIGVISKQRAQDHAMCKTGLVGPRQTVRYNDAFCIEQAQSGMQASGKYDFVVLPYALRHKAQAHKGRNDYSRFWPEIIKFNKEFGISGGGHLVYFYDKFKDQLGDFIAQFECQPGQVGAIVLIENRIVGVEIAPNPEYWTDVWKALIRDCYGTEVVRRLVKGIAKTPKVTDSKITQANSLDELDTAVRDFEEDQRDRTEAIIANVADTNIDTKADEQITVHGKKYQIYDVKTGNYVGQVVKEDNFICYASITANAGKIMAKKGFAF